MTGHSALTSRWTTKPIPLCCHLLLLVVKRQLGAYLEHLLGGLALTPRRAGALLVVRARASSSMLLNKTLVAVTLLVVATSTEGDYL